MVGGRSGDGLAGGLAPNVAVLWAAHVPSGRSTVHHVPMWTGGTPFTRAR